MNSAETEFIAEKELVSIVPNFNYEVIYLISGDIGPFRAGLPVKVPIWLAMSLKRRQKCRIVPPRWMNVEDLEEVKKQELNERFFTKMPSEHYMVEAHLLLSVAADDIPRCEQIRTILKDIWDIRMSKLRSSVDQIIKTNAIHARLDHLTLMEINSIRPLLPHALDQLFRLQNGRGPSQASGSQAFTQ
ncbi:hypothetical protein R5R35_005848 [Gryllus longicercus]|uniref:DNA replication complex GINS protein PSF2 n=1 Tax=Gryllus longicercus TaxID=2509291 RepID=A0AAN9VLF9_9ORTH|nr:Probable DNA replication complex GINS protein PSF2 [Gryllus bimaculatus]